MSPADVPIDIVNTTHDDTVAAAIEPLALRAPDAARALGLSERALWSLTRDGSIPCVRLGSRVVYPVNLLREWLDEQGRRSIRRRRNADDSR